MDDNFDVLNQLVPLSPEHLAQALDLDQLQAVQVIVEERIAALQAPAAPRAAPQPHLPAAAAAPAPLRQVPVAASNTKSRWDSDSDDEEAKARKEAKRARKNKKMPKSDELAACTTDSGAPGSPPVTRRLGEYLLREKLSEGTYGEVFRAEDAVRQIPCVLKRVKLHSSATTDGFPISALREVSILRELVHPNIVKMLDVVVGPRLDEDDGATPPDRLHQQHSMFVCLEAFDFDLTQLVGRESIPLATLKYIVQSVLRALEHMHGLFYMHRDLKPANVLCSRRGRVCVCDFGMARSFDFPLPRNAYTPEVVTLHYRAPELLLETGEYGASIDLWSLGCIFAELVGGGAQSVLKGSTIFEQLNLIWGVLGAPGQDDWPQLASLMGAKGLALAQVPPSAGLGNVRGLQRLDHVGLDLLAGMLRANPLHRLTAPQALAHPWFSQPPAPLPFEVEMDAAAATETDC
jgi:cell division cycle 2-like protein